MSKGHLDKEYYVPSKAELLKYADESYYKKTSQTNAILNFFMKDMHMNKSDAEEFLYEAVFELRRNLTESDMPDELRVQMLSELIKIDNVKPISKNALYPCENGKKYKRCYGKNK